MICTRPPQYGKHIGSITFISPAKPSPPQVSEPLSIDQPLIKIKEKQKATTIHRAIYSPSQANTVLYRAQTTWPYDLFPDQIIIQEGRITIHKNQSPWDKTTQTILTSNIVYCEVTYSMFFATVSIQDKFGDVITLRNMKKIDAKCIKEIVDGLMMREIGEYDFEEPNVFSRINLLKLLGKVTSN